MADPGFPVVGGGGANLLFGKLFAKKLHENKNALVVPSAAVALSWRGGMSAGAEVSARGG